MIWEEIVGLLDYQIVRGYFAKARKEAQRFAKDFVVDNIRFW